jgi:hypothetical protein
MKPDELQQAPKEFCESIKVGFTPEFFAMGLSSGNDTIVYALTPTHIKRLQQYLGHEISAYEKQYGEIKATWSPNVVSPIQKINPPSDKS